MNKTYLLIFTILLSCQTQQAEKTIVQEITIDADQKFQTIDGFGVNITPAQWRNGNLKPVIDRLVDDLGCTLFRFDAYGQANWLDPNQQLPDGTFPETYLKTVYTSKIFQDAWACFRYLNSKGIEPIFNISGMIPVVWGEKTDRGIVLKNHKAYAEMVVSLVSWAREKEKLKFSYFMPFNETDLGYVEGPLISATEGPKALRAVELELNKKGFSDLKLVIMDDAYPNLDRAKELIKQADLMKSTHAYGIHTYGNGQFEDSRGDVWYDNESHYTRILQEIKKSPNPNIKLWLTEFGDLDQTELMEYGFAWNSTRRLIRFLNDGGSAGIAWDAFDNFHEHDTLWAKYGLLKTDTTNWTYSPRVRYSAYKHIFKFVKPNYQRIATLTPQLSGRYKTWLDPAHLLYFTAYLSPDKKQVILVGMNNLECAIDLNINFKNFGTKPKISTYYVSTKDKLFEKLSTEKTTTVHIQPQSIFTVVGE